MSRSQGIFRVSAPKPWEGLEDLRPPLARASRAGIGTCVGFAPLGPASGPVSGSRLWAGIGVCVGFARDERYGTREASGPASGSHANWPGLMHDALADRGCVWVPYARCSCYLCLMCCLTRHVLREAMPLQAPDGRYFAKHCRLSSAAIYQARHSIRV